MRYLTIILLTLLTACNISNSKDDSFKAKKIGTWEIVKEDSAVWVGEASSNKMKTDTLIINEVGDYGLLLSNIYENNDGSAKLYMYDSTFVWDESYPLSEVNLITEFTGDPFVISLGGGTRSFGEGGVTAEVGINYNCGEIASGEEVFEYKIAVGDSVIRHYQFIVYGLIDTISEISC